MGRILVKKRHSVRKSQISALLRALGEEIGPSADLFKAVQLEIVETTCPYQIYLVDRKPLLFSGESWVFPTLRGAIERPFPERRVTVDSGAVKFVVNGADIMRPGIVAVSDDVKAGRPVQIAEERHGKPLAIGIALLSAEEMRTQAQGKMVKSLHHVGDDIWNLEF
jgi:PUA domain protein